MIVFDLEYLYRPCNSIGSDFLTKSNYALIYTTNYNCNEFANINKHTRCSIDIQSRDE